MLLKEYKRVFTLNVFKRGPCFVETLYLKELETKWEKILTLKTRNHIQQNKVFLIKDSINIKFIIFKNYIYFLKLKKY